MFKKSRFLPYPRPFKPGNLNPIPEYENTNSLQILGKMTQPTANNIDIFNSLRIPDAVKDLPKFDGNQRLLFEFISNVEEILHLAKDADNTVQGRILLRAIRNKIEGQANEVLNMYGTTLNWDEIKTNLICHYADKRTETSLIKDLHSLRQNNKPAETFYSEILEIQAALANNLSIHETEKSVVLAKRNLFAEMCLNSFLSGLREPMGSTIRAMRPESLPEALDYCIREQNINYIRFNKPNWRPNNQNISYFRNQPNQTFIRPKYINSSYQPRRDFQFSTHPYQSNNYNFNRHPSWNQTQRPNEHFQNRNFNQRFDNTSGQTNIRQSRPEPMDTNSGLTKFESNTHKFKTSPSTQFSKISNRFEMNNINEFRTPRNTNPFNHEHLGNKNLDQYANIDDNQDFYTFASDNRQDT